MRAKLLQQRMGIKPPAQNNIQNPQNLQIQPRQIAPQPLSQNKFEQNQKPFNKLQNSVRPPLANPNQRPINSVQKPAPQAAQNNSQNSAIIRGIVPPLSKQTLMVLTCQCKLERNGFQAPLPTDTKIVRLQKDSVDQLCLTILFRKSGKEIVAFSKSQIVNMYADENILARGCISFVIAKENASENPLQLSTQRPDLTKILLSNVQPDALKGMHQMIVNPPQSAEDCDVEMEDLSACQNDTKKRLPYNNNNSGSVGVVVSDQVQKRFKSDKPQISLSKVPWDCLNIIFDYTPKSQYKFWKLNKTFSKLINKRRKGLIFNQADIPPVIMENLIKSSQAVTTIRQQGCVLENLAIVSNLKHVKKWHFNQWNFNLKYLQTLDLSGFNSIGDTAMSKLFECSSGSLQAYRQSYGQQGFQTDKSVQALANCKQLKHLQLCMPNEYQKSVNQNMLRLVKMYFYKRQVNGLEVFHTYDCDGELLQMLLADQLQELQIVRFVPQTQNAPIEDDILKLKHFKSLKKLNLCSTWHPVPFTQLQNQNDIDMALELVPGQRQLEQILFSLKNSLTELYLGDYISNDLILYLAEMYKTSLQVLSLVSQSAITDGSINHVLKRCENLKALDVAGVFEFTGQAFGDFNDPETEFKAKKIKFVQCSLQGYEQQVLKERLKILAPECKVLLNTAKVYKI